MKAGDLGSIMLALDHVALVLPDVDAVARRIADLGIKVGAAEEFESENTREIYVETAPVKILLMQPRSSSGPIGRHVARRGHGFHHLGFVTTDVRSILRGLRAWLICPSTFRNLERKGPAWIARPDANLLVELTEVEAVRETQGSPSFREVTIAFADLDLGKRLLDSLGLESSPHFVVRTAAQNGIESVALDVPGRRVLVGPTGEIR